MPTIEIPEIYRCPPLPLIEAAGYYRGGRRGRTCEILVMHYSAGWGNELRLGAFFRDLDPKKRSASANMGIGRKGGAALFAPPDQATWHAGGGVDWDQKGQINLRSFGIEMCNRGYVREKTALSKAYAKRAPAGFTQAKHAKGRSLLYWENYGQAQIGAMVRLIPWIMAENPSIRFVCGHEDLVKGKMDPGPMFPWTVIPWEGLGLVRMERDWRTGTWYEWKNGKRREYRRPT